MEVKNPRPPEYQLYSGVAARQGALSEQVGGDHYRTMKIQPVEFIQANDIPFLEGCVIKRMCRWRTKGAPLEDLKKAKHEIDLLIEFYEKG